MWPGPTARRESSRIHGAIIWSAARQPPGSDLQAGSSASLSSDHGASGDGGIAGEMTYAGSSAEAGSLPLGVRRIASSPFGPTASASGFAG